MSASAVSFSKGERIPSGMLSEVPCSGISKMSSVSSSDDSSEVKKLDRFKLPDGCVLSGESVIRSVDDSYRRCLSDLCMKMPPCLGNIS